MFPTLPPGKKVLVSSLPYLLRKPRIDELVVIKDPRTKRHIVKRITAKKKDRFFVRGDNASMSTDSRHFGWVTKRAIIGKVFFVLK